MKINISMLAIGVLLSFFLYGASAAAADEVKGLNSTDRSVLAKIEDAVRAGHIDTETAILYNVYAVKDYSMLPERFHLSGSGGGGQPGPGPLWDKFY